MQAVIIFVLILAVLLVIFTLQNSVEISISVFFWTINDAPLVLVLISCIVIGYIIAAIYFYPRIWKIKKENRQLTKINRELKEIHAMNPSGKGDDSNPEGISLNDESEADEENSFFKD